MKHFWLLVERDCTSFARPTHNSSSQILCCWTTDSNQKSLPLKKAQNHSKKNVQCHPGVLQFWYFVWSKWGALKGESTRSRIRSRVLNISFQPQNMTLKIARKTVYEHFSGPRNTSQIVTKGNEPIPASAHSVTGILWHGCRQSKSALLGRAVNPSRKSTHRSLVEGQPAQGISTLAKAHC